MGRTSWTCVSTLEEQVELPINCSEASPRAVTKIVTSDYPLLELPFSDDVNKDSQLLMRRNIRDRTEAAKDLADYQRLTAEGKLGEAGQKLEELKRALDKLKTR